MAELELKMNAAGVDPNLIAWLQAAARQSPYRVVAYSGMREGDPRFHGKGKAIDINLIDPQTGKTIPNYQSPEGFAAYQAFANNARAAQMQMNPEAGNLFRWGGYFGGGKGKYGALDLMHFDVGGVPTAGGSWEQGLNPAQASAWNLTPGGGVSGSPGGVTGVTALGDTLAGAIPPEDTTSQDLLAGFAKGVSKSSRDTSQSTPVEMGGSPGEESPPLNLETPSAVPPTGSLETPGDIGAAGVSAPPGLADLFQVAEIGLPIPKIGRPYERRGF